MHRLSSCFNDKIWQKHLQTKTQMCVLFAEVLDGTCMCVCVCACVLQGFQFSSTINCLWET